MLVNIPYTNLIQGVSQQPAQMRLASQAAEQINAYSSPTEGLTKRPPTQFLGVLEDCPSTADSYTHFIDRDTSEKYILAISGATIKAYTLTGAAVPVYGSTWGSSLPAEWTTYMTGATASSIRCMSVADSTFVTNTSKVVAATTATSAAREQEALVVVTQGAYKSSYKIMIKVGTATEITYEVLTWGGQSAVGAELASIQTDAIVSAFQAKTWPTDITATQYGSTLYLQAASGKTFTVRTTDSASDSLLVACKGNVPRLSDLPITAPIGFSISVSPDVDVKGSTYWVSFVASDVAQAQGVWEETIAPGILYALNPATMPFKVTRKIDPVSGLFMSVEPGGWAGRAIGDLTTNPWPSFVGQTIQDMFFFKNRFGFLSADHVVLSESGGYTNFFRTTVADFIDSDPIDVGTLHTSVSTLRSAVAHGENLILFSDQAQFILGAKNGEPLTPSTASCLKTTEFSSSCKTCRPATVGRSIFFTQADARYAGLREYFQTSATTDQYDGQDLTSHVNSYITGVPQQLAVSSYDNLAVVRTSTSVSPTTTYASLWNYKWLQNSSERIQSAWSRWDFPLVTRILGVAWVNKKLYMVFVRDTVVHLEYMDFEIRVADPLNFLPHIDCLVKVTGSSFASSRTALPTVVGSETVNMVPFANGALIAVVNGYEQPILEATSTNAYIQGNRTAAVVYLGISYEMLYTFSPVYMRNQNIPVVPGRLTLTYGSIGYAGTGNFKVSVDVLYRAGTSYTYSGGALNAAFVSDAVNLGTGSFRFPIHGRNEDSTVTVSSASHLPIHINAASFEAHFVTRAQ